MIFHTTLAICAFMMVLLGTRIAILAMRSRRESLGYHYLTPKMQKLLPPSIQGGGIVFVFSVVICMAVADIRYSIIIPVLLLTAITLLEKLITVPWILHMLVQMIAITFPLSTFQENTFGTLMPPWIDVMVTGAIWMLFINMFSGMDKLDGLSASGMITICTGLYIAAISSGNFLDTLPSYSLIVAAAGCGFLWWNWSPAKIALGRIGTIPLGFLIGYLLLLAIHQGLTFCVLILPAYYLSDSAISWIRRTWNNERVTLQHNNHYYQQAIRNHRKPLFILRCVFGINILLIFLAVYSVIEPELRLFNVSLAYLSVFMMLGFFADKSVAEEQP